jgi:hypothetical protein
MRGDLITGVFVSFEYGDDFDRDRVVKVATEAGPMFRGMPGVIYKFFTVDDAARRATNFYLWESRETAEQFFTDELRARVVEIYGVDPVISYVDVLEVVDNSAHTAASENGVS